MIKCKKGAVTIKGTGGELLAELTTLVHAMYDAFKADFNGSDEKARKLITSAIERGFKSIEELEAEAKGKAIVIKGSVPEVLDQLKSVLEELEGKDDE